MYDYEIKIVEWLSSLDHLECKMLVYECYDHYNIECGTVTISKDHGNYKFHAKSKNNELIRNDSAILYLDVYKNVIRICFEEFSLIEMKEDTIPEIYITPLDVSDDLYPFGELKVLDTPFSSAIPMTKIFQKHLPGRLTVAFDILTALTILAVGFLVFIILFPFALLGMVGMGVWEFIKILLKK